MTTMPKYPGVLWLTIPLVLIVALSSMYSLLMPDFYSRETANWALQSSAQDAIDLVLLCPVLLVAAFLAARGNVTAMLGWAGAILYILYTYVIYAFALHFNSLFLAYCACLGLAFYAMVYFIQWLKGLNFTQLPVHVVLRKGTALFFCFIAMAFYGLWLGSVIPELGGVGIPDSLQETGLFTNPVHVLDLSIILPGIFIVGILMWKNNPGGMILAPVLLSFFVLMNITIAFLHAMMLQKGMVASQALVYIMVLLALLSVLLLTQFSVSMGKKEYSV